MKNFWQDKRVFITGHTGFKGGWLSYVLHALGAQLVGYSRSIPTNPSFFEASGLADLLVHNIGDIRHLDQLETAIDRADPEIVIHMAAQPLVRHSYADPIETYSTNVMGTVNLLEIIRRRPTIKSTIIVTSDKCYENLEQIYSYREHDRLGGFDPYSNSKGCAEMVVNCYTQSYFQSEENGCIASVRAGNVIGGGDFVESRLVPDTVKSLSKGEVPTIRSPNSLRPWQHVLEPISGYMAVAEYIYNQGKQSSKDDVAWNFGPNYTSELSVKEVTQIICDFWQDGFLPNIIRDDSLHEAKLLALDSTKARMRLGWSPRWGIEEALRKTVEWYKAFYEERRSVAAIRRMTLGQIEEYFDV